MTDLNVYVPMWSDLDMLKGLVPTLPDATVYVVDGRYADFPGDEVRTPGAREWCEDQSGVEYVTPPDDLLPWGHEAHEAEPFLRHPGHEQAVWVNHEFLPQDEWVIHIDTDERVEAFDRAAVFNRVRDDHKYVPYVDTLDERDIGVPRLYKPKYWTFWIGGVFYPRDLIPRDTPLVDLFRYHTETNYQLSNRAPPAKPGIYDCIRLRNVGADRPADYHERRAAQLETMGRPERANDYREMATDRT